MADTIWCRFDKTFICPGNLECLSGSCPYLTGSNMSTDTVYAVLDGMKSKSEKTKGTKMTLEGNRKFFLTIFGMVLYTVCMVASNFGMDPFALGLGLGLFMAPTAAANAYEHYAKRGQ